MNPFWTFEGDCCKVLQRRLKVPLTYLYHCYDFSRGTVSTVEKFFIFFYLRLQYTQPTPSGQQLQTLRVYTTLPKNKIK